MEGIERKLTNLEKEMTKIGINTTSHGLPLPEYFSGTEDFDSYLRPHQWSAVRCAQILPLYLIEEARAIYDSLDGETKSTWKNLTDALASKLKKLNSKESARRILASRKQNAMESILEYAQTIRGLINKAFPENSFTQIDGETPEARIERIKSWRDDIAKDYFRNGLRMEIKEKLAFQTTNNMEETINQAKEIEEIQKALKEDKFRLYQNNLTEKALLEVNAVRAEVNAIKEKVEQSRTSPQQSWRGGQRNEWRGRGNFPARGNWNSGWNRGRREFRENRNGFQSNWRGNFLWNEGSVPLNGCLHSRCGTILHRLLNYADYRALIDERVEKFGSFWASPVVQHPVIIGYDVVNEQQVETTHQTTIYPCRYRACTAAMKFLVQKKGGQFIKEGNSYLFNLKYTTKGSPLCYISYLKKITVVPL
uniref:Retrotransposon gag domain-containing protein n=1 Tax=Meloidogyne hapla TaxID=6305 RepID=A0A1I8BBF4_MELHA